MPGPRVCRCRGGTGRWLGSERLMCGSVQWVQRVEAAAEDARRAV